ncbi:hypothetical protein ACJJTC_004782 [Scirpophaga incertulas]
MSQKKLLKKGYIYKSKYSGWYSVNDESFVPEAHTKDEMINGEKVRRYENPSQEWLRTDGVITPSKYQKQLQELLENEGYLPDISVSRPSSRVHWAIQVPNDDEQSVYVWLDALVNYLTSIGYPDEDVMKSKGRPWPADVHVIGKDILKFHGIYWPAFLMAANWPPPRKLVVHGHWTVDGVKMSKSLGNVVSPDKVAIPNGLRYLLLREATMASDANYSEAKLVNVCNSELADTLGNLCSRCCGAALNPRAELPPLHAALLARLLAHPRPPRAPRPPRRPGAPAGPRGRAARTGRSTRAPSCRRCTPRCWRACWRTPPAPAHPAHLADPARLLDLVDALPGELTHSNRPLHPRAELPPLHAALLARLLAHPARPAHPAPPRRPGAPAGPRGRAARTGRSTRAPSCRRCTPRCWRACWRTPPAPRTPPTSADPARLLELVDALPGELTHSTGRSTRAPSCRRCTPRCWRACWRTPPAPRTPAHLADPARLLELVDALPDTCRLHYNNYQFYKVVDAVIQTLHVANHFFETQKPWELKKNPEHQKQLDVVLHVTMETLRICGIILQPIIPDLSAKLLDKLQIPNECRTWKHCEQPSWRIEGAIYEPKSIQGGKFVLFQRTYVDKKSVQSKKSVGNMLG